MSGDKADLDFESASVADLPKLGLYKYSEDQSTRIWMASYSMNNGPVRRWHPGDPAPTDLLDHIKAGGRTIAHNSNFERQMWNKVLRRYAQCRDWPELQIEQMDCTQSRALAMHLPADLDTLAIVLGLSEQKDKEGSQLMKRMARPRKINADGSVIWWDDPAMIARLGDYCDQDVRTEQGADHKLLPLSPEERRLWELDQVINDRGILVDENLIRRCQAVLEQAVAVADEKMCELTGGFVRHCTEATRIVDWLTQRGVPCDSIAKGEHAELIEVAKLLGDTLAVAVVELRGEAARSSTAKFQKMRDCRCADGRLRGLFNYHRASTGRWGGALVQPHNLPRIDPDREGPDIEAVIQIMLDAA